MAHIVHYTTLHVESKHAPCNLEFSFSAFKDIKHIEIWKLQSGSLNDRQNSFESIRFRQVWQFACSRFGLMSCAISHYNFQVIILRNSVESEHLLSDGPAAQEQPFPADYAMSAALSDADLANLLMSSPLYRKLGEIKRTMEDGTLPQRKRGEGKKSAPRFTIFIWPSYTQISGILFTCTHWRRKHTNLGGDGRGFCARARPEKV